jgi:predicted ATPase
MLLRFEVANHRSIHEPVELSMIAVDADRPAARGFRLLNERVLTVAGIYGANASGKSNVLDALAWLSAAVRDSLRMWVDAVPRDPFRFGDAPGQPSTYEVETVSEGVRYAYRLEVTGAEVVSESLVSYPKRQPRTLFERDGMDLRFRRGLPSAAGTRELLTPTTLALSAIMRFGEAEVLPFGSELRDIVSLGVHGAGGQERQSRSPQFLSTSDIIRDHLESEVSREFRESAIALMRFPDLGIDDVVVVPAAGPGAPDLKFLHRGAGTEVLFDLSEESAGTQTWFRLVGPVIYALREGLVLAVDEIDASLHPRLAARLLELFQDPATNPRGAQLIFTTHDTSLLNYLNRDEVWLTEKDATGATALTALAEYKVRSSVNLERAYLQGRFGAVPELD